MSFLWLLKLVIINFTICYIIVLLFDQYSKINESSHFARAFLFGLILFILIAGIPIFSLYILTTIHITTLLYFLIEGFVECLIYGILLAAI